MLPVDHSHNRFTPRAKVLELDLTNSYELQLLLNILKMMPPDVLHLGLPCGTCSRAREKPIPGAAHAPQPLRDALHPFGLPGITDLDAVKVSKANQVYSAAVEIMLQVFKSKCLVVIENPQRSWLWTVLAVLVKQTQNEEFIKWYFALVPVDFDSCMWGGKRAKATRFLCSNSSLNGMALQCDNSHTHAPWGFTASGTFATAEEAEYPTKLCKQYIACVLPLIEPSRIAFTVKQFRLDTLQGSAIQSPAHPQLVSDFHKVYFTDRSDNILVPHKILSSLPALDTGEEQTEQVDAKEDMSLDGPNNIKVGIYKSPEQHYREASKLQHPMEAMAGVPHELSSAVSFVLARSPLQVARHRLEQVKECISLAKSLDSREKELRGSMHASVNQVTCSKRIELFRELLKDIDFPDMSVVDALEQGVCLTGWEPESSLYTKRYNPPTLSVEALDSQAFWRRKVMLSKPPTEEELDKADALWAETVKEVELGFLSGPFTEEEVSEELQCQNWSASKRFLLLQGEEQKPRVIDDLKASGVNAAFGSTSYLNLQDADFLSCFLMFLSKSLATGEVVTPNSIVRNLNSAWYDHSGFQGRGVDLSKAYKQVSIHPSARRHAVIAVRQSSGAWSFFLSRSMPFRASASVFAFNKLSKAIWAILVVRFKVLCSVFFDDYPVVEHSLLTPSTTLLLDTFLDLLGWDHATTGKKAVPFSSLMTVLGVTFNLEHMHLGKFKVFNKAGRLERIIDLLLQVKQAGRMTSEQISVLQGFLGFAGRFVLGRALKRPMHVLSSASSWKDSHSKVRAFCDNTVACIKRLKPRYISVLANTVPILIYTDGAYENGVASWGAVVIDHYSSLAIVHHGKIPTEILDHWRTTVGQQLICQVELVAFALVRMHYESVMCNRACIAFIDNEAARFCLIKGGSPSKSMFQMVECLAVVDARSPSAVWYERVCAHSNLGDLPSRDQSEAAAGIIGGVSSGPIPFPKELLDAIFSDAP